MQQQAYVSPPTFFGFFKREGETQELRARIFLFLASFEDLQGDLFFKNISCAVGRTGGVFRIHRAVGGDNGRFSFLLSCAMRGYDAVTNNHLFIVLLGC